MNIQKFIMGFLGGKTFQVTIVVVAWIGLLAGLEVSSEEDTSQKFGIRYKKFWIRGIKKVFNVLKKICNIQELIKLTIFKVQQHREKKLEKVKTESVMEEFIQNKLHEIRKIYRILFTYGLLCVCIKYRFNINIEKKIFVILCVLISLIYIYKKLLRYRYRKEYFGVNYAEAKELVYFMMKPQNTDKPHKGKRIFNNAKQKVKITCKKVVNVLST